MPASGSAIGGGGAYSSIMTKQKLCREKTLEAPLVYYKDSMKLNFDLGCTNNIAVLHRIILPRNYVLKNHLLDM